MSKEIVTDGTQPVFRVRGRLVESRAVKKADGDSFHVNKILFPASDEFSHPTSIFVNSSHPLGQAGTDVDITVGIYGFERRTDNGIYQNHVLNLV